MGTFKHKMTLVSIAIAVETRHPLAPQHTHTPEKLVMLLISSKFSVFVGRTVGQKHHSNTRCVNYLDLFDAYFSV